MTPRIDGLLKTEQCFQATEAEDKMRVESSQRDFSLGTYIRISNTSTFLSSGRRTWIP